MAVITYYYRVHAAQANWSH